jgi:hypothetical protein
MRRDTFLLVTAVLFCSLSTASFTWGAESAEELAQQAQNPVAKLISVPFQDNINFNVGPQNRTQNVLNIQPVVPVSLTPELNLITRTIVPVISQPGSSPSEDRIDGIGPLQFTAFLSPNKSSGLVWGVGPIFQAPTITNDRLGSKNWGIGPSAVALSIEGHWVVGALVNNVFSVGGTDPTYSTFLLQPFINYNLPDGLYLTTSPIITADWKAAGRDTWTVPLGGGVGKIWKIGKLPVNTQVQAFGNVHHPEFGADWTLRLQVQLMFPKSIL